MGGCDAVKGTRKPSAMIINAKKCGILAGKGRRHMVKVMAMIMITIKLKNNK